MHLRCTGQPFSTILSKISYAYYMSKNLESQDTIQSRESGVSIYEAFARYNATLLSMSASIATQLDLTLSEMVACDHLQLDGPLKPGELAQRVQLSSGAITSLIDRLEKRGFVKRERHPSDRRSVLVYYLPQEQAVVGRLYAIQKRFLEKVEALADDERESVSRFLSGMAGAIAQVIKSDT